MTSIWQLGHYIRISKWYCHLSINARNIRLSVPHITLRPLIRLISSVEGVILTVRACFTLLGPKCQRYRPNNFSIAPHRRFPLTHAGLTFYPRVSPPNHSSVWSQVWRVSHNSALVKNRHLVKYKRGAPGHICESFWGWRCVIGLYIKLKVIVNCTDESSEWLDSSGLLGAQVQVHTASMSCELEVWEGSQCLKDISEKTPLHCTTLEYMKSVKFWAVFHKHTVNITVKNCHNNCHIIRTSL